MNCVRFLAVVFLLACSTSASFLPALASGPTGQLETIIPSGAYRVVHESGGAKIVMEGFGYRMEPGKPMLPEGEFLIALPPGAKVQRVETEGIGGKMLPGTFRIAPAPPPVPLAEPPLRQKLAAEMHREWQDNNRAVYSADNVYPKQPGNISNSGSLRKYAYVSVAVSPFNYRPVSGKLTHFDAVRITVYYGVPAPGTTRALEVEALMGDRVADKKASEMFINYDQVKSLYQIDQQSAMNPADAYDYVIITADSLNGAVSTSDFVSWKTTLGYNVRTVLTTDPEIAAQPGGDLAEQMRNFLRSYYGLWGIQYVLLVGDYATVPMRYCYPNPDDHSHNPGNYGNAGGSVPTDFYYADLSFPDAISWDSDGDGYLGEYTHDNPDFLAEVYVGRIPTSDVNRITYTLDKMVRFEQDDGAWKDQALQPGTILFYANQDFEGYPTVDGCTLLDLIETNFMSGWTVSRYSEQSGLVPSVFPWAAVSVSAFIDDWRTGQYGLVNWSGHGAPYGVARTVWDWDDGDGVPETDGSDGMSNPALIDAWCNLDDDHPSVVFAVSCNVGYPEPNGVGNLGIDLLTKPGFGAAAGIVSSSRPAWVTVDIIANPAGAEMVCYEFNRYTVGENERLGEAIYDAKHFCYQNYGWDHYAEHINQFNFDLYGDPSMMRRAVVTAADASDPRRANAFVRLQNYPNPFNPVTTISFTLFKRTQTKLSIHSVDGKLVTTLIDNELGEGFNKVTWDGKDSQGNPVSSGVYFCRLDAGNQMFAKKMVLLK
jgi:hypothetical protein